MEKRDGPGGAGRRYRPASERERDDTGPAPEGDGKGGKGPSRGGRRSNEPTSHGVVPTRAPSRFFLLLQAAACLPREVPRSLGASLFFSLLGVVALAPRPGRASPPSFSRLYYSYFHAHVLRLCGSTIYVSRRSFLRLLPYGRAGAARRDASRNCSTESCIANRPTTCCFGIDCEDYGDVFFLPRQNYVDVIKSLDVFKSTLQHFVS